MSILASLARAYDRLPDAPPFGFSPERIGWLIALGPDGMPAHAPIPRADGTAKKKIVPPMFVPQAVKRTAGIRPNFLWDKTAYVLGVTAGEGKRTAEEHAAFVEYHRDALAGTEDAGLSALAAFLGWWKPERFAELGWPEEVKDDNVAFALESDRRAHVNLHDRPAAKALWARLAAAGEKTEAICLVSGERAPVARLHPSIKGVWGAQSAGASIVSFNIDAFTSYGHEQGDNAPVSEAAAFAYTTALNRFLARDSGHNLQIGDASTVFWADASEAEKAALAEGIFAGFVANEQAVDERTEAEKVGTLLKRIRNGEPLKVIDPYLVDKVRFYVLGLTPNAARLSIRFFYENDFGNLVENMQNYFNDIQLAPERPPPISITRIVIRLAPARFDRAGNLSFETKRVSSLIAGELLRSILTGDRFPGAMLPLLLMRIRGDHHLDRVRIALIKALIVRDMRLDGRLPVRPDGSMEEDYLVRSDPDDPNPARRLGRLFALIERAQLASLGDEVNATVKDKYLGAAAATPLQVFVPLLELAEVHLKRLRNGHSDAKTWIKSPEQAKSVSFALGRDIGKQVAAFNDGFPAQHSNEEQGLFLIGYYQERYGSAKSPDDIGEDASEAYAQDGER